MQGRIEVLATAVAGVDPSVLISDSCADPGASCLGLGFTGSPVFASLEAGKAYTIIVDDDPGPGTFELTVDACVPSCAAKSCGTDGCGGSCGACGVDQYCFEGQCSDPGCGELTLEGCCDDNKLLYCEDDEQVSVECASVGSCGWDETEEWYDCGFEGADPSGEAPIECPAGT